MPIDADPIPCWQPFTLLRTCPDCDGRGQVLDYLAHDGCRCPSGLHPVRRPCRTCYGRGRLSKVPAPPPPVDTTHAPFA